MTRFTKFGLITLAVSVVVLGLKYLGYRLTGSIALYSDALESIVNVIAALAMLIALAVSSMPADANHPYGHNKAEYLSSVLESTFIVLAALQILHEAYLGFIAPTKLGTPWLGIGVSIVATLVNSVWGSVLVRAGRHFHSPAMEADGRHLWTDVVSSGGVALGVVLVALTGWDRLDSIIAALVALHVLWAGWQLLRSSLGGLMDEALPEPEMHELRQLILTHADGALQANSLRARRSGSRVFIEFNLVVPAAMNVGTAHAICDRMEAAIRGHLTGCSIFIHLEPEQKILPDTSSRIVRLPPAAASEPSAAPI